MQTLPKHQAALTEAPQTFHLSMKRDGMGYIHNLVIAYLACAACWDFGRHTADASADCYYMQSFFPSCLDFQYRQWMAILS